MVDVRQVDRDGIDRAGFEGLRVIVGRVEDRLLIQGAGHPIHEQQRTPVRGDFDELGDKVGVGAVGTHLERDPHRTRQRQVMGQLLAGIHQAVVPQGLDRALVHLAGGDQHVAPAERRVRLARIVGIPPWVPSRGRAEAALARQEDALRSRAGRRPGLRSSPIIGSVGLFRLDPRPGRIEDSRFGDQIGWLVFQIVAEPLEIGITGPAVGLINEMVCVGTDPQFLRPRPRLNLLKRRQHTGQKDVVPCGGVKAGNRNGAAEIVRRPERVWRRMCEEFVHERLPDREVRVIRQRQAQPVLAINERQRTVAGGFQPVIACAGRVAHGFHSGRGRARAAHSGVLMGCRQAGNVLRHPQP